MIIPESPLKHLFEADDQYQKTKERLLRSKTGAFRDCWNCGEGVQMMTSDGEHMVSDYCPNCNMPDPCGDKPNRQSMTNQMNLKLTFIKSGAIANGLKLIGDKMLGYKFYPVCEVADFANFLLKNVYETVEPKLFYDWCELNKNKDEASALHQVMREYVEATGYFPGNDYWGEKFEDAYFKSFPYCIF